MNKKKMNIFKRALATLTSGIILMTTSACGKMNNDIIPATGDKTAKEIIIEDESIIESIDYDKTITFRFSNTFLTLDDYSMLLNIDKDFFNKNSDNSLSFKMTIGEFEKYFSKNNISYNDVCMVYEYGKDFNSIEELCISLNINERRLQEYNNTLMDSLSFEQYFKNNDIIFVPITDEILEKRSIKDNTIELSVSPYTMHNNMEEISYTHMNGEYAVKCDTLIENHDVFINNNKNIKDLLKKNNIDDDTCLIIADELEEINRLCHEYKEAYDNKDAERCKTLIHTIYNLDVNCTNKFLISFINNNTDLNVNSDSGMLEPICTIYEGLQIYNDGEVYNLCSYLDEYYLYLKGAYSSDTCSIVNTIPKLEDLYNVLFSNYSIVHNIYGYYCMTAEDNLNYTDVRVKTYTKK